MDKHIRQFTNFQKEKNRKLFESVIDAGDAFRVKTPIDVPKSLINQYAKKVKDESGKNIKTFWSEVELAEELLRFLIKNYMKIENFPVNALVGNGNIEDLPSSTDEEDEAFFKKGEEKEKNIEKKHSKPDFSDEDFEDIEDTEDKNENLPE